MTNETREQEIWKTYPEYPFIEASNLGRMRTKDHWVTYKNGRKQLYKSHVLKQQLSKNGYMYITLSVNGKAVYLLVHRVIAVSFLPNPDNLPEVNHKDNDRTNNAASNLEWCTSRYNMAYKEKYGISAKEATKVLRHPLIAINPEFSEVFWFESQHEAARQLGVNQGNMNEVVKRKRQTAGGYWFCNADENAVEKVRAKFGDEIAEKVEELLSERKII